MTIIDSPILTRISVGSGARLFTRPLHTKGVEVKSEGKGFRRLYLWILVALAIPILPSRLGSRKADPNPGRGQRPAHGDNAAGLVAVLGCGWPEQPGDRRRVCRLGRLCKSVGCPGGLDYPSTPCRRDRSSAVARGWRGRRLGWIRSTPSCTNSLRTVRRCSVSDWLTQDTLSFPPSWHLQLFRRPRYLLERSTHRVSIVAYCT